MKSRDPQAGFTILEIVVVMGLLASFVLMLVQLTGSGVEMFAKGQRGQHLADRAMLAARAVEAELGRMVGPARIAYEPQDPDARMFLGYENIGFARDGEEHDRVQVLRATVGLTEHEETELLKAPIRESILEEVGEIDPIEFEKMLAAELASTPRFGRGDLLMLPWPVDKAGVFFELRRGVFIHNRDEVSIMEETDFGSESFPASVVPHVTEVVATGLLHIEFALWSPRSISWGQQPASGGPEYVWDSARAGRLLDPENEFPRHEVFGLDLGEYSLRDTRDDVFPRWIRVTLCVARNVHEPPEAFLLDALEADTKTLRLTSVDQLPKTSESRYLKIGSEWVKYDSVRGNVLSGIQRGRRNTLARPHKAGSPVRAGRTVTLYQRIEHGREGS